MPFFSQLCSQADYLNLSIFFTTIRIQFYNCYFFKLRTDLVERFLRRKGVLITALVYQRILYIFYGHKLFIFPFPYDPTLS